MFECYCNLFRCNGLPVDRIAILAIDDGEADVITSTARYRMVRETTVSMDAKAGIVRFTDTDAVSVCVMVPDERDRAIVVELIQRPRVNVRW